MMLMISGATVSVDDAALFAGHHLLTIVHRTIDIVHDLLWGCLCLSAGCTTSEIRTNIGTGEFGFLESSAPSVY